VKALPNGVSWPSCFVYSSRGAKRARVVAAPGFVLVNIKPATEIQFAANSMEFPAKQAIS
jgi:hypothetical protein